MVAEVYVVSPEDSRFRAGALQASARLALLLAAAAAATAALLA
jgi:hypothetical protein